MTTPSLTSADRSALAQDLAELEVIDSMLARADGANQMFTVSAEDTENPDDFVALQVAADQIRPILKIERALLVNKLGIVGVRVV